MFFLQSVNMVFFFWLSKYGSSKRLHFFCGFLRLSKLEKQQRNVIFILLSEKSFLKKKAHREYFTIFSSNIAKSLRQWQTDKRVNSEIREQTLTGPFLIRAGWDGGASGPGRMLASELVISVSVISTLGIRWIEGFGGLRGREGVVSNGRTDPIRSGGLWWWVDLV